MSATPAWVWRMHREFFRYAIPFTFGPPARRPETPPLPRGGTCVVVQFSPGEQFLIAARHVMVPALGARETDGADCLAGNVRLEPDAANLSTEALDIATLRLSDEQTRAIEADGYLIMRPGGWPPPALADRDPILVAGFPGAWREQVAWDTLDLRGATTLALVHHLREDEFVCQLDPAFVDRELDGHDNLAEDKLPGMSGGPAILVRQEAIIVPHLCGLLKQGLALEGGNQLLSFARLDRVRQDGTISG